MKRTTIARTLSVIALTALAAPTSLAGDYECTQPAGCIARKAVNGKLVSTKFHQGDLISTKDGWIVNTDDGWDKVKSKNSKKGT